jgi:hypothetical protein
MKADLTRNTFNPFQHFDRLLMQQGRVQLDADWNEQGAILLHYLRSLAADLIGPQGGPANNLGFGIAVLPSAFSVTNDFQIGLGRYYVDGILCEADTNPVGFVVSNATTIKVDQFTLDGAPFRANQLIEVFDDVQLPHTNPAFSPTVVEISNADPATLTLTLQGAPAFGTPNAPKLRRVYTYLTQPDCPLPSGATLADTTDYLIYVDVWERLITYVENDAIREVALGGADTATRAKIVWQVKAIPGTVQTGTDNKTNPCDNFNPTDENAIGALLGSNRGRLKARAKQTTASTDPCIIPPGASYTGPENQLYRVEIHRPGGAWDNTDNGKASAASFKWSRENGSVVYPIVSVASGGGVTTVVLENLGRDDRFGLSEGEWVEIQDDTYVLQNRAETMLQVQSIDRSSMTVTLSGTSSSGVGTDPTKHPLLRRWDYQAGDPGDGDVQLASDMAALVIEGAGTWLNLEDGIQIQFEPPDTGEAPTQYSTSDYWLIPARTATGDVEWPTAAEKDNQGNIIVIVPLAKPPDGVEHHYAPLGVISVDGSGVVKLSGDCRKQFSQIAQIAR